MQDKGVTYFPHSIEIEGVGIVVMILEMHGSGDDMVCGIYQMIGKLHVKPKAWLRIVREQIALLERDCKESGVSEMRLAGRDWSRVLTDYEPFPALPNGLRKVLN